MTVSPSQYLKCLVQALTALAVTLIGANSYAAGQAGGLDVPILMLKLQPDDPALLSNVFITPEDQGIAGAALGISDNNTTGRFLNQHYHLETVTDTALQPLLEAAAERSRLGVGLIVADMPQAALLQLLQLPGVKGRAIVFNAGSFADELRTNTCQTGLLHTLPSRAMLADALAQVMVKKRWQKWLLVKGQRVNDQAYADAIKRAAKRFGAKIINQKTWTFETDLRRLASQEVPAFTQGDKYDLVVVADELGDIGEFIPYNTYLPRPVVGTQGLTPVAWHPAIEQWGARQLQNRFLASSGRSMRDKDYAAWLAVRVIGEAVTRVGSASPKALYPYMLSDEFEIAAFKGRSLSFRTWNGQMRQTIALVHPRALIAQAPVEGFLHPVTELDTLGYDRPESRCSFSTQL